MRRFSVKWFATLASQGASTSLRSSSEAPVIGKERGSCVPNKETGLVMRKLLGYR